MLTNFALLLLIHYIADFPLQGDFLGTMKGKYDYLLFVHTLIWSGCVSLGLIYLGIFSIYSLAFLFIGHFFMDRWKSRKEDKTNALTTDLWIDQTFHFFQIVCVCVI